MGDPRVPAGLGGKREHLVVVAPFFLDRREVTVADFRPTGLARKDSQGRLLDPYDGRSDPLSYCVYSDAPGAREALPLNCVSFELARAYCKKRGGDLPTEAQFEVAASARGTRLWPWGDDDARCEDAVASRGGPCGPDGGLDPSFPEPAGTGRLDRAGDIVDLGANLSEWTLDHFQLDDEPCWAPALLVDPVCGVPGRLADARSAKGGHFQSTPVEYAQIRREKSASNEEVGFRCAYPAR
jgi:formylglycine-generating enzyme required for sulfatase activity